MKKVSFIFTLKPKEHTDQPNTQSMEEITDKLDLIKI